MIDSSYVMGFMKLVYVLYLLVVASLFGMYAWSVTKGKNIIPQVRIPFYGWVGLLVCAGVGLHIFTFNALPWVKWDLTRSEIRPEREYKIIAADHEFRIPQGGFTIDKGQMVRFKVESRDYTYGFGLFRADGSMVFQMQVVPGASNDIVWKFEKVGTYTIRSTEYSGPRGAMVCRNAVSVVPALETQQAKVEI